MAYLSRETGAADSWVCTEKEWAPWWFVEGSFVHSPPMVGNGSSCVDDCDSMTAGNVLFPDSCVLFSHWSEDDSLRKKHTESLRSWKNFFHTSAVNCCPRSNTMSSPKLWNTWWNRASPVSMIVGSPLNCIILQALEKRSTATRMHVLSDGGMSVTKSIPR